MGLRHAALVTRSGEAYTWGDGASGKLGLGHAVGACSPQRVHMLWGQHIKSIIAGGGVPSPYVHLSKDLLSAVQRVPRSHKDTP